MLIGAVAERWEVPAAEITTANSMLRHEASGRSASYGEMSTLAARQAVPDPETLRLKEPKDFVYIGKTVTRKDVGKTDGSAIFTQDVQLEGMLTAVVAHAPRFGGKVRRVNDRKARDVKGVVDVVQIPSGVAVLAHDFWSARKGRDLLEIDWDESNAFTRSSADLLERYRSLTQQPGKVARHDGNVDDALAGADRVIESTYEFPFLAHAAMEPMNCVVRLAKDVCELWYGAQIQTQDQFAVAKLLGITPEQVRINTLYAGGGFGRRGNKDSDYVVEAAEIAKAIGGRAPVKLVWLREDDMRAGYYRPLFHHRLWAGLDEKGNLVGWHHRLVGQSILTGAPPPFGAFVKNGIDPTSVEGAKNLPYAVPNLLVDLHTPADIGVPVQWWRSVGSTHTAFSTECFIDELAAAAGKDPLSWRLGLLEKHPRHAAVLKLAAEKAGWERPLAAGKAGERRGRGVAVQESFRTCVAQVAEVTVQRDGSYRVDRVVSAVDCGLAVNPDIVQAQVEGSIGFALSTVLSDAITLTEGKVDQSNFHDYQPLRIGDMPRVEVHIRPSTANPTGIGEPAVPPLAPAVANALAAATGKRVRKLPIRADMLKA
jgi:isoquinoline 1-oxidoreductase beta subunit